jgi:hypothetical protein
MTDYAIIKSGSLYSVVRNGTDLMASYTYSGGSDNFIVYDWTANASIASWSGSAAGPTVATFSTASAGGFGLFDSTLQSQFASWTGTDSGTPYSPPAPPASGLPRPANQAELQALINTVDGVHVFGFMLDPTTPPIAITSTLTINVTDVGDSGLYFDFSRVPLQTTISDGVTPMVVLSGSAKHMVFKNLVLFGNAFSTAGCGDGLVIRSNGGPILKSQFQDISSSWCGGNGISVQGDVYENTLSGWDCKNNKQNGVLFSTPNGGVISNLVLISPSLSDNVLSGAQTIDGVQSIDMPAGGSFINNLQGGWNGAIRSAAFVNFENTGAWGFNFSATGLPFMATIIGCNLTSDGGSTGVAATSLIKYSGTANLQQTLNYCTAEGALHTPPPVLAP